MSLFAIALFTGQSVGVALAAPMHGPLRGRPIFLVTAVVILAIAFWFRRQLVRQPAGVYRPRRRRVCTGRGLR